jgi:hypothetical protein
MTFLDRLLPFVGFFVAVAAGASRGVHLTQSSRCSRSYGIDLTLEGTWKARREAAAIRARDLPGLTGFSLVAGVAEKKASSATC